MKSDRITKLAERFDFDNGGPWGCEERRQRLCTLLSREQARARRIVSKRLVINQFDEKKYPEYWRGYKVALMEIIAELKAKPQGEKERT